MYKEEHVLAGNFKIFLICFTVLLTVFTSCTARHFLNASTEITLSKTFNGNKSKAAEPTDCSLFTEVASIQKQNTAQLSTFGAIILLAFFFSQVFDSKKGIYQYSHALPIKSQAPLYILYKQRKILS